MNNCIDLILDKAFCIFIFFHFPDSRLSVLKGFHLDLGLFWSKKLDVKFSRVFIRYEDTH